MSASAGSICGPRRRPRRSSASSTASSASATTCCRPSQRLRHGIANLNREGRERLLEAFGTVNGHFGSLFTTLFGGGRAELQLIESEDPLEAGLEILAHPPGKRPTGAVAAVGRRAGA